MTVPTRWRTTFTEQLANAEQRVERAERHLNDGDGSRALQEAYPAVVGAASVRVWTESPPWRAPLAPDELQRRVRDSFPNLFAAMAEMKVQEALTSPWRPQDAEPYVREARAYVEETRAHLETWLDRA